MPTLLHDAQRLAPDMVAWRRELHQWPELGHQEHRTSAFIRARLDQLGISYRHPIGATGIVATIGSDPARPTIALRADFDALPIEEENDLPYRSQVPGHAHLCGHDAHTAILLGAAALLQARADSLGCNVRLLFQHAEEVIPSGAPDFVAAGALDGVQAAFALHNAPLLPAGSFGVAPGPVMAACVKFDLTVTGAGGHAAMPELARNPLPAAGFIAQHLPDIAPACVPPGTPAVLTLCSLHGGDAFNVIPEQVTLTGTARAFDEGILARMHTRLADLADRTARAHGVDARLDWVLGTPPVLNDAACCERLRQALLAVGADPARILRTPPVLGAEDFAWISREVPACYFFLGTGDPAQEVGASWHSPRFRMNESVLPQAAAAFAHLALA